LLPNYYLQININFLFFFYLAFHRFGQAKFPDGGLILGLSQLSILPQKILVDSKVVKIDPKIVISLCKYKSVTHSVGRCKKQIYFCANKRWTLLLG
jgi:hypothetical protein